MKWSSYQKITLHQETREPRVFLPLGQWLQLIFTINNNDNDDDDDVDYDNDDDDDETMTITMTTINKPYILYLLCSF